MPLMLPRTRNVHVVIARCRALSWARNSLCQGGSPTQDGQSRAPPIEVCKRQVSSLAAARGRRPTASMTSGRCRRASLTGWLRRASLTWLLAATAAQACLSLMRPGAGQLPPSTRAPTGWRSKGYDMDGNELPLQEEDKPGVRLARSMQRRIVQGNQLSEDMDIDGWAVGGCETEEYGLTIDEEGQPCPKPDFRWLENRPQLRRFPALIHRLEALRSMLGFMRFWHTPLARPSRDVVLLYPVLRRCVAVLRHPRLRLVFGTEQERNRHVETGWRAEHEVHRPCCWCGQPTQSQCPGIDTHSCRRAICTECVPTIGRCEACLLWFGLPPTFPGAEESGVDEATWYRKCLDSSVGDPWPDVWDGVGVVPDP